MAMSGLERLGVGAVICINLFGLEVVVRNGPPVTLGKPSESTITGRVISETTYENDDLIRTRWGLDSSRIYFIEESGSKELYVATIPLGTDPLDVGDRGSFRLASTDVRLHREHLDETGRLVRGTSPAHNLLEYTLF